jgi:hypothetical protein
MLFQQPSLGILHKDILFAMVKAAAVLGTMMFVRVEDITDNMDPFQNHLIPCMTLQNYKDYPEMISNSRMVEVAYTPGIENEFAALRDVNKELFISVGIPLDDKAVAIAMELSGTDVDTLHFYADNHGCEVNAEPPRFMKEMIREIHLAFVEKSLRQKVNLIFSGGIAMAEHVNKAIICGADGVAIDNPLLIAMECQMCYRCTEGLPCPAKLEEVKPYYGVTRIVNLMAAWRNQILEMLGAMGLREVRRLRGEVGRSLWFEDLEKENFGPIFGKRKVS